MQKAEFWMSFGSPSEATTAHNWDALNKLQLGRYAEYLAKMEFTRYGFAVYTAEVDDKGIDFVIRKGAVTYYDVQVKSSRGSSYIFFPKEKFELRANNLAVVVVFEKPGNPHIFVIAALAWQWPNQLLVSRNYGAPLKSKPEWGINLSTKNWPILERFAFESQAKNL
jgi:hypothetical protein